MSGVPVTGPWSKVNEAVWTVPWCLKSKNRPYRPAEVSSASNVTTPGAVVVVDGVDVGVGEVPAAHGHEVAAGAEVRLEVGDDVTVAGDGQVGGELAVVAALGGEVHLVAVGGGLCGRFGQRRGLVLAGDGEVGAEGEAGSVGDLEVGDGPVRAGVEGGQVDRPGAVSVEGGVDVVEGGELPVDDDQVQVAFVDRGEVVDGLVVLVFDGEPERAAVAVEGGGGGDQAIAVGGGDDALADRGGGFGDGLGDVGADGCAEPGADTDDGDEGDAEGGEACGRVHRASSYPASSTAAATASSGQGLDALGDDGAGGEVDGDTGDAVELGDLGGDGTSRSGCRSCP